MKKLAKLFAVTLASVTISLGSLSAVEIKKIHFLIPGGAGGGWDGTARGTGEALKKAGLIDSAHLKTCPAAVAEKLSAT